MEQLPGHEFHEWHEWVPTFVKFVEFVANSTEAQNDLCRA
jgi:hypothetical protein